MTVVRERGRYDRRDAGHRRVIIGERLHDRLARLPSLCEELLGIYPRDELQERAEIAMDGLPYRDVMALALRLRPVRDVIAALPADFSRWA